jgi:Peptidase family M28
MAAEPPRRRPRRGSLERPLSIRIYRAAWLAVAIPLLVAAFSVGRPDALSQPRLAPFFDGPTALQLASEFAGRFPDRSPGSPGAARAADWVAEQFRTFAFEVERQPFSAEVPGRGREEFVNVIAVAPRSARAPVRSQETIVVTAHRDNLGVSPGANENGSGTAALLELARNAGDASLTHTFVFVSTDGGAFGGLGAEAFVESSRFAGRIIAVVNLDAIGDGTPRIEFASDNSRVPSPTLLATTDESVRRQTGADPERNGPVAQLLDLAFPFSFYEQAPFIARGMPAVTLTAAGERPPPPEGDTVGRLADEQLAALGRSGQALLGALDEAAEVARGTDSYLYLGSRLVHGWTIQFVLLAALVPFLAATVDLFARCRRRHIPLAPALRGYASRLGVWLWAGGVFALFTVIGIFPSGADRPIAPDSEVATDWPVAALLALLVLSGLGWIVAHARLVPTRSITRSEELGGHLAAMLALAVVALVVAATNPYALLFVLPSLHAWLWLPQVSDRGRGVEAALLAAGFAGPLLLLGSFAFRFDLGVDALWYVVALTSVGLVPVPLVLAFLAWGAAASQVGAVALGRYAPYPDVSERSARGPLREAVRRAILLSRRARGRPRLAVVDSEDARREAERSDG